MTNILASSPTCSATHICQHILLYTSSVASCIHVCIHNTHYLSFPRLHSNRFQLSTISTLASLSLTCPSFYRLRADSSVISASPSKRFHQGLIMIICMNRSFDRSIHSLSFPNHYSSFHFYHHYFAHHSLLLPCPLILHPASLSYTPASRSPIPSVG